jgi:hypothetical protein
MNKKNRFKLDLKNINSNKDDGEPDTEVNFPPVCESPRESYISESQGGFTGRLDRSTEEKENPISTVIDYFEVDDHDRHEQTANFDDTKNSNENESSLEEVPVMDTPRGEETKEEPKQVKLDMGVFGAGSLG